VLANPPKDAASHYDTGVFCERIFDFARAVEHYRKAGEADPKFRVTEIPIGQSPARRRARMAIGLLSVTRNFGSASPAFR